MFGIADYGAFVAAIVVFLMIPGPGNLALITSTSKGSIAMADSPIARACSAQLFLDSRFAVNKKVVPLLA